MKFLIEIDIDSDECGMIYAPGIAEFPTKNPVKDVAKLISDIIDEAQANDGLPAPTVYPEVNLKAHPEYSRKRVADGLMMMSLDPRANPREKFLAAAISHALRK